MSYAIWRLLEKETSWQPEFFAGHSLGEYSALVAAKKLLFSKAVSLVHKRGQFMQEAVPSNEGAMMVTVDSGLGKYQYIIPAQAQ